VHVTAIFYSKHRLQRAVPAFNHLRNALVIAIIRQSKHLVNL
jgi:hypothetical protein